jgi:hypothetical protein
MHIKVNYFLDKGILTCRSSYFENMLCNNLMESQDEIIKIKNCDFDTFSLFIEYLYTTKIKESNPKKILNLYGKNME